MVAQYFKIVSGLKLINWFCWPKNKNSHEIYILLHFVLFQEASFLVFHEFQSLKSRKQKLLGQFYELSLEFFWSHCHYISQSHQIQGSAEVVSMPWCREVTMSHCRWACGMGDSIITIFGEYNMPESVSDNSVGIEHSKCIHFAWRPKNQRSRWHKIHSKGRKKKFLLALPFVLFWPSMSWMMQTHWGRQSTLLSLPIQVLILSANTLTDKLRNSFIWVPLLTQN